MARQVPGGYAGLGGYLITVMLIGGKIIHFIAAKSLEFANIWRTGIDKQNDTVIGIFENVRIMSDDNNRNHRQVAENMSTAIQSFLLRNQELTESILEAKAQEQKVMLELTHSHNRLVEKVEEFLRRRDNG